MLLTIALQYQMALKQWEKKDKCSGIGSHDLSWMLFDLSICPCKQRTNIKRDVDPGPCLGVCLFLSSCQRGPSKSACPVELMSENLGGGGRVGAGIATDKETRKLVCSNLPFTHLATWLAPVF